MAYTYEDFVNAATSAGMMERFDETDLQTAQKSPEYGLSLLSLMGDMDNAQTEEQRLLANEAMAHCRRILRVSCTASRISTISCWTK